MENGTYVSPPPLPPPAHLTAAAAFQAATTQANVTQFQEALMSRMGRPFGLTDMKDLHGNPFAASLGLAAAASGNANRGGGSSADSPAPGGFSLPLLGHMGQPPFLHHVFDPRLPFPTAGAFRPIFGTHAAAAAAAAAAAQQHQQQQQNSSNNSSPGDKLHSAFQPPKRSGSPPVLFSPGQNLFPRTSAGSPGSPSSSPPTSVSSGSRVFKTDENSNNPHLDRHESVSPMSMDSHDEERAAKKMRITSGGTANDGSMCGCPICGMPLRPADLETHYSQELEYLAKLSNALHLSQQQALKFSRSSPIAAAAAAAAAAAHHHHHQTTPGQFGPTGKNLNSPGAPGTGLEVAPRSRWDTFQRIQRNRQSRIRVKLSRRAGKRPDEVLEEDYQHRKIHSGNEGGNGADEDIDIVGDEKDRANTSLSSEGSLHQHIYGPPQFTEADVLNCMSEENNSEVTAANNESNNATATSTSSEVKVEAGSPEPSTNNNEESCASPTSTENIDVLKEKLRQLEDHTKCSKCTNTLKNPVVNVGCWHIQCERCWLVSLGTDKCCSQCGVNSTPQDLRRVFL